MLSRKALIWEYLSSFSSASWTIYRKTTVFTTLRFSQYNKGTKCKPISVNNSLKRTLTSNWSHTILPFSAFVGSTTCVPLRLQYLQYLTSEGSRSHGWLSGPGYPVKIWRGQKKSIRTSHPLSSGKAVMSAASEECNCWAGCATLDLKRLTHVHCHWGEQLWSVEACEARQKETIDGKAFLVYFYVNAYKHRLLVLCALLTCLAVAQAPP